MRQFRRVVTGHDADGKAVVISDGPAPFVHVNRIDPEWYSTDFFRTGETPARILAQTPETTEGSAPADADAQRHGAAHQPLPAGIRGGACHDAGGFAARLPGARQREGLDLSAAADTIRSCTAPRPSTTRSCSKARSPW